MKIKPEVTIKENSLIFDSKSLKMEIKEKLNLNDFVEFFMIIFAEILLAKYRFKNKEVNKKLKDMVKMN